MESLLRELYYKGCGIKSDSKKASKEEQELVRLLNINQEKLKNSLDGENKVRLEKFIACYDELSLLCGCQEFISGFRLGGRIVMEIFFGEKDFSFSE